MLPKPIWEENGRIFLIDQTKLPNEVQVLEMKTAEEMWAAIRRLAVRGAPAIGLAAAFGVFLGVQEKWKQGKLTRENFVETTVSIGKYLDTSRPTAVNLHWAVRRMVTCAERLQSSYDTTKKLELFVQGLLSEAIQMLEEDIAACLAIGKYGADVLEKIEGLQAVLTHCNAGALATSRYGTALAPIYLLQEQGKQLEVYSDETRPLLQGARLTAWELSESGIPVTTICDSMAGVVMAQKKVQAVIVGADRIAANGDTANKIGTYSVAVLAKAHGIPCYVAAPFSTVDASLERGDQIPIEERKEDEIRKSNGKTMVPEKAKVYNPAFDVTPAQYITAIITEKGVAYPPFHASLAALQGKNSLNIERYCFLQEQVLQIAKKMQKDKFSSGSFGNVSMIDRQNNILAITPSGIPYEQMEAKDICLLHIDGTPIQEIRNRYHPSSEWKMHCMIYERRKDCSAILHSHATYATAYASTGKSLPMVISELGMLASEAIPCVSYYIPGSEALAEKTAEVLQKANGCLLANHGMVTVADTLDRAYTFMQILEDGAKVACIGVMMGNIRSILPNEAEMLHEKMKKYGQ